MVVEFASFISFVNICTAMKGCYGTKEFSVKSRICKNCNIFSDCEKIVKKNMNKFIMVSGDISSKNEALVQAKA